MTRKILIADDEEKIRTMLNDYLTAVGFDVIAANNGFQAVALAETEKPDLIVLDVMMPGIDGLDCIRNIRKSSSIPVILLTARAEESDKLIGLELGADDYIIKPFSLKELAARIRAVLRRSTVSSEDDTAVLVHHDLTLDPVKMHVLRGTERITLTTVQFAILKLMMSHPGQVFTRIQLLNTFQEQSFEGYERTVDVHIKNIRKAIEKNSSHPEYILTVWGTGYRFAEEG